MNSIAVIGEAVADAFATPGDGALRLDVRPGGSPANTAVALSRLGTPTRFLGRLSRGVLGRLLRDHLERSGVTLSGVVDSDAEATLAIAALDSAGRASYDFYVAGTADWQWRTGELDPGDAVAIHTGSLALVRPPGDAAITACLRARRPNATISIDPNVRPGIADPQRYRRDLDEWAGLADILKLSHDDLAAVHPGIDRRRLIAGWHGRGTRLVIVTLGAEGALASLDGHEIHVASPSIRLADTIGAGDAFSAGLLHHLRAMGKLGGRLDVTLDDVRTGVAFAARVAARTCEVPGADPPWADHL